MSEKTREFIRHIEWFSVLVIMIVGFFILITRIDDNRQENHEMMQQHIYRTNVIYDIFIDVLNGEE